MVLRNKVSQQTEKARCQTITKNGGNAANCPRRTQIAKHCCTPTNNSQAPTTLAPQMSNEASYSTVYPLILNSQRQLAMRNPLVQKELKLLIVCTVARAWLLGINHGPWPPGALEVMGVHACMVGCLTASNPFLTLHRLLAASVAFVDRSCSFLSSLTCLTTPGSSGGELRWSWLVGRTQSRRLRPSTAAK